MMRIQWLPEARAEVLQAARYYRDKDTALVAVFTAELRAKLESVARFPESGFRIRRTKRLEIRRTLIERFEYAIEYAVLQDAITVIAVHHQHRKPGYWRPRLAKVRP